MHSVNVGRDTDRHGACSHLEPALVQYQQSLPVQVDSAIVSFSYKFQTQQSLPLQVQTLSLQAGNSAASMPLWPVEVLGGLGWDCGSHAPASAFGLLGAVPSPRKAPPKARPKAE